jgi:hypothetical protein
VLLIAALITLRWRMLQAGDIIAKGMRVGVLGVVHPEVLGRCPNFVWFSPIIAGAAFGFPPIYFPSYTSLYTSLCTLPCIYVPVTSLVYLPL